MFSLRERENTKGCELTRTDKAIVSSHIHPVLVGMDLEVPVHGGLAISEMTHRDEGRCLLRYLEGRVVDGALAPALDLLVLLGGVGMYDAEGAFGLGVFVRPRTLARGRHEGWRSEAAG